IHGRPPVDRQPQDRRSGPTCRHPNIHERDRRRRAAGNRLMPKVTYIEHTGKAHTVEVKTGQSAMEGAVRHNIPGIVAECGGACSCPTCHVHVDAAWFERTGPRTAAEVAMLDYANDVDETSRLSCQIKVGDALDGLVLRMPEKQG